MGPTGKYLFLKKHALKYLLHAIQQLLRNQFIASKEGNIEGSYKT